MHNCFNSWKIIIVKSNHTFLNDRKSSAVHSFDCFWTVKFKQKQQGISFHLFLKLSLSWPSSFISLHHFCSYCHPHSSSLIFFWFLMCHQAEELKKFQIWFIGVEGCLQFFLFSHIEMPWKTTAITSPDQLRMVAALT